MNILCVLAFYAKYPGWHCFNNTHGVTKRAIRILERRGFLEVNEFNQAKFTGKTIK